MSDDPLEIPAFLSRQTNQPAPALEPRPAFVMPATPPHRPRKRKGIRKALRALGWRPRDISGMSPALAEERAVLGKRP